MDKNNKKIWGKPVIEDHGDVIDIVKGIGGGGGKEPGGNDGDFTPLEVS